MISILLICSLLGLGSAWTQPSTCYVRQSACSADSEVASIRDTLDNFLGSFDESLRQSVELLTSINSLLIQMGQPPPTDSPTEATTMFTNPPSPIGTFVRPGNSCQDIAQDEPSGYYYIGNESSPIEVFCDMNRTDCICNSTRGWTRVANLDMTDPSQDCPEGFRFIERDAPPLRVCGRPGPSGCVSTTYETFGIEYSHVCGRVTGYRENSPDVIRIQSIEENYVDGVSLTYGNPRRHLWTFIGASETTIPDFVDRDFFCSFNGGFPDLIPLWVGQERCDMINDGCCEVNNPPWFCRELPEPTTDDIELRLCGDQDINDEDTPIDLVEIYVR